MAKWRENTARPRPRFVVLTGVGVSKILPIFWVRDVQFNKLYLNPADNFQKVSSAKSVVTLCHFICTFLLFDTKVSLRVKNCARIPKSEPEEASDILS